MIVDTQISDEGRMAETNRSNNIHMRWSDDEVAKLDELRRHRSGRILNRSEMLRALVDEAHKREVLDGGPDGATKAGKTS